MSGFIRFILYRRAWVAVAVIVSSCLAAISASRLRFQFQFRDFYDYPSNRDLPVLKRASADFGDPAGNVVVLLQARDVFEPQVLAYVRLLTSELEADGRFAHVDSLTNAHAVRGDEFGITTGPVADPLPASPDAAAKLRQFVLSDRLFVNRLVSANGAATGILAELRTPATFASIPEQSAGLEGVRGALARHPPPPGVRTMVTGAPAVEVGTTQALLADQLRLTPCVLLVLGIALFVAFRSMHGILLSMTSVGVATLWTAGIVACLGTPVDIVGSIIPTTILVYGVVDPVFVLTRFLQKTDNGAATTDAIVESLSELALPCFLTSLTTALGFAAFMTSSAPTIRQYGLSVAIGVALSWVTTLCVLPVLLASAGAPRRRFEASRLISWIDAMLVRVWRQSRRRLTLVPTLTLAVLALGGLAARRQSVVNQYVGGLPHGEIQDQVRELESALSGVIRYCVYLEGPPESMRRPEVLQAMERIENDARRQPLVTYSASLAAVVGQFNQAFLGESRVEDRVVPKSRALVAQYLALLGPRDRSRVVTDDFSRSQIAILARDEGSAKARALGRSLSAAIADSGLGALGVRATLTGAGIAAYRGLDEIVREVVVGFFGAFLIVVVFTGLLFRSWRVALISIVPNLVPIACCFLTLRAFSLNVRMDSSLVLGVCIGGLFNTTIHLAARLGQLARVPGQDRDAAVEQSLRSVGPAALFTAAILSAGFSVLMISRFPGLQVLGLLSMVTFSSALLADIALSPLLLRAFFPWPRQPSPKSIGAMACSPEDSCR